MTVIVIVTLAVLLQLAAAFLAVRLVWVTGLSRAWLALALAILVMLGRRGLALYRLSNGDVMDAPDVTSECFGLAISLLMFAGVAWIAPIFRRLQLAQQTLEESQRQLGTLMHNLPGMAYRRRSDEPWTMEFVSEGCLDLTGHTPSDLVGEGSRSYKQLVHPEDVDGVHRRVLQAVSQRSRHRLMYRIRTANGAEKWVWEQGSGVYSEQGEVVAIEGFVTDVTEKRKADERSEHLNAVLRDPQREPGHRARTGSGSAAAMHLRQFGRDAWIPLRLDRVAGPGQPDRHGG